MLTVKKFGGTSVGSVARIKKVAKQVAADNTRSPATVVVLSAMSGETNRLLALAKEFADRPDRREADVLVSTGEQVTVALFTIALRKLGVPAVSFLGHQIQIETDSVHGQARIKKVETDKVNEALRSGKIPVIAGFQGADVNGNVTTLGRGGSDTTAVAIASAIGADVCEIYTDVEGVYSADPRVCPSAHKLERISYDEMLELSSLGAKVLQIRSVEFAKRYGVPVHVRSSFSTTQGTWLVEEDDKMESVIVSGVTSDLDQAKITLLRVPDRPGLAAKLFGPIAEEEIVVDMIIQNAGAEQKTDVTFTVPRSELEKALARVRKAAPEIGAGDIVSDSNVAKVSIVGLGMRSHAGVASRMFEVLAAEGINIQMISTSEIKISIIIDAKYAELAVRVLHDALISNYE